MAQETLDRDKPSNAVWRSDAIWARVRPALMTLIPVALFCLSIWVVDAALQDVGLDDVTDEIAQISWPIFGAALLLVLGSYIAMALQDRLGLALLKRNMLFWRTLYIAFVSNAVGQNIGVSALSSGAVRWTYYARQGLSLGETAFVTAYTEAGFAVGALTLISLLLAIQPASAGAAFGLSPWVARAIAAFGLLAIAAYIGMNRWRKNVTLGGVAIDVPKPVQASAHILLGVSDFLLSGLALALLVDPSLQQTPHALAAFIVAACAAAISGIPGGLGSFEAVFLSLSPASAADTAAALALYRILYYILPLGIAGATVVAADWVRMRDAAKNAARYAEAVSAGVAPPVLGAIAAIAGFILLVSGVSPGIGERMDILSAHVPLMMLEASHMLGSFCGVALLILARGLFLRLQGAFVLTMFALAFGALASLVKGLDVEEATIMIVAMGLLWFGRRAFYRPSALLDEPFSLGWAVAVAILVGATIWLGLFSYSYVEYDHSLWWEFAFDSDAPRFLRGTLIVGLAAAAFALLRLLRARSSVVPAAPDKLDAIAKIVAESPNSEAWMALLGDKAFVASAHGDTFLMYGAYGRSWISFADPIGDQACAEEVLWAFRELCDSRGVRPVYYQIDERFLPTLIDMGMSFLKLGEEGRVKLESFELKGKAFGNLRHSYNRVKKEGAVFEVVPGNDLPAILPRLKEISDAWLKRKNVREKGFTLGQFNEAYLRRTPCAIMRQGGQIVAFANVLMSGEKEEISIDLMRQADDAPQGTMDFLFTELCFWGQAQGYRWFNMGLAPLSGFERRRLASTWVRVAALVFNNSERFYNFSGLRRYKEKFRPVWRPKYLAAPSAMAAMAGLVDASALVSGGIRGVFDS